MTDVWPTRNSDRPRRTSAAPGAEPDAPKHRKRLVWNGVCGCREFVIQTAPKPDSPIDADVTELRALGEVSEPLS